MGLRSAPPLTNIESFACSECFPTETRRPRRGQHQVVRQPLLSLAIMCQKAMMAFEDAQAII